jgi:hypothetical protein
MICFPLRDSHTNAIIGIVQVVNKDNGAVNYTSDDEARLGAYCGLLSYLILRYPVDLTKYYYDPKSLHQIAPFEPCAHATTPVPLSELMNHHNTAVVDTSDETYIYRTNKSGRTLRNVGVTEFLEEKHHVGYGPLSLNEVDDYILKLENLWKQAVETNLQHSRTIELQTEQLRELRNLSKKRHSPETTEKRRRRVEDTMTVKDHTTTELSNHHPLPPSQISQFISVVNPMMKPHHCQPLRETGLPNRTSSTCSILLEEQQQDLETRDGNNNTVKQYSDLQYEIQQLQRTLSLSMNATTTTQNL